MPPSFGIRIEGEDSHPVEFRSGIIIDQRPEPSAAGNISFFRIPPEREADEFHPVISEETVHIAVKREKSPFDRTIWSRSEKPERQNEIGSYISSRRGIVKHLEGGVCKPGGVMKEQRP